MDWSAGRPMDGPVTSIAATGDERRPHPPRHALASIFGRDSLFLDSAAAIRYRKRNTSLRTLPGRYQDDRNERRQYADAAASRVFDVLRPYAASPSMPRQPFCRQDTGTFKGIIRPWNPFYDMPGIIDRTGNLPNRFDSTGRHRIQVPEYPVTAPNPDSLRALVEAGLAALQFGHAGGQGPGRT